MVENDNRKTHLVWKEGLSIIFYISLGISQSAKFDMKVRSEKRQPIELAYLDSQIVIDDAIRMNNYITEKYPYILKS